MEIHGNLLRPDDKKRLDEWRQEHSHSFAGFQQDPELPPHGFRTAGDLLFISPDFYKQCFGDRGAMPDVLQ